MWPLRKSDFPDVLFIFLKTNNSKFNENYDNGRSSGKLIHDSPYYDFYFSNKPIGNQIVIFKLLWYQFIILLAQVTLSIKILYFPTWIYMYFDSTTLH